MYHQLNACCKQLALSEAEPAQPFTACPLHEFQIVDVIDDATGIGIFDIDTQRQRKLFQVLLPAGWHGSTHGRTSPLASSACSCGTKSKCSHAWRVTTRPRAVRIIRPC